MNILLLRLDVSYVFYNQTTMAPEKKYLRLSNLVASPFAILTGCQWFSAIFEFHNGGQSKPEIVSIKYWIELLVEIKTWNLAWQVFNMNAFDLSKKKWKSIFSAECTIGMVRGLTPLKHYGTIRLD